jgi:squalene cyclase
VSSAAEVDRIDPFDAAILAALRRLTALRRPDGYFEGYSDAGVAFDAGNLVLARFVGEAWPEQSPRVMEKLRHILSGQHTCGLFRIYPGGPCSLEATRIVALALECATSANGADFPPEFKERLDDARKRALAALASPECPTFDIPYLAAFRLMLLAFDENSPDRARLLPHPAILFFTPAMAVGLAPMSVWKKTDRIVFPFISVLPELVGFSAWRAVETSKVGGWFARAVRALPEGVRRILERPARRAARWLLEHQDTTGGFYYSVTYTFLFIAALRNAAVSPSLFVAEADAVARALGYVRARETLLPTGIASSFLASDVWDTVAVATALLEAPPGFLPPELSPATLGSSVLAHQSPSGGFSFGRGSKYPDCDSTGLTLGLFSALLRDRAPADPETMRLALTRAFDFLALHKSKSGGFNAWTIRRGAEAPPVPRELRDVRAVVFDVSSADVTARIMVSLGRLLDLAGVDAATSRHLGPKRIRTAEQMRRRGLDYLLSTRDSASGLWPARWTLGFIIGTRFVFDALDTYPDVARRVGPLRDHAARTLVACQNEDGGFGESQDSDLESRFTPSSSSAALITAAAYGLLREANAPGAAEAASRALTFILRSQDDQGGWPEVSLCTQFPGLYASYELMTLVALTTTLLRARPGWDSPDPTSDGRRSASERAEVARELRAFGRR